jgi:hypothetical protein
MQEFCHSCAMPLNEETRAPNTNFCKHCVDDTGNVHPREAIQAGIAQWFKSWQPDIDDAEAQHRASFYLKSMPHWAD